MIIEASALAGVYLVRSDRHADARGYFARTFCADRFADHGLPDVFLQGSTCFNTARGTLRGLHWQAEPHGEGKLVRCVRGAIYDVAVDVRSHSPSLHHWVAWELTAENGIAVFIPPGFAHGFQTLADDSEVSYQMTARYAAASDRGLRWDDAKLGIPWPIRPPILSVRDAGLPGAD